MNIIEEFKQFAMRGNVLDMAVGVIMGAAFAPIVSTLVENILMPPLGFVMAGVDFSSLAISLPTPTTPVEIKYGLFLNALLKFLITAFAIFLLIKTVNNLMRSAPPAPASPPPPTPSEVYLKEIRDALTKK